MRPPKRRQHRREHGDSISSWDSPTPESALILEGSTSLLLPNHHAFLMFSPTPRVRWCGYLGASCDATWRSPPPEYCAGEWASVFDSEPSPKFLTFSAVAAVSKPIEGVIASIDNSRGAKQTVTAEQALAYDLVDTSFFAHSPETRFILLVTAIEAILTIEDRSDAVASVVAVLMTSLEAATSLTPSERNQLSGALNKAKKESINQAGKEVALTLNGRLYDEKRPDKFFGDIYGARSDLVHGNIGRPTTAEVSRLAPIVETFVIDLLDANLALHR